MGPRFEISKYATVFMHATRWLVHMLRKTHFLPTDFLEHTTKIRQAARLTPTSLPLRTYHTTLEGARHSQQSAPSAAKIGSLPRMLINKFDPFMHTLALLHNRQRLQ
jgi:hypothetical protein